MGTLALGLSEVLTSDIFTNGLGSLLGNRTGPRAFTTGNANEKSRTTLPYEPWRSNGSAFCSGVGRTAFPMTQLVTPRLSKSGVRKSLRKSIGKMSLVSLNWLDFLLDIVTDVF